MTNERIVFTRPDGGVSVVVPTGEVPVAELKTKVIPSDATNVRDITTADLPANRLYRNAWDDSNPETFVGVNMTKAKEIAHGRRRAKREEVLAPDLEIVQKNASGIPLKANQNATEAQARMDAYMTDVDDVAQVDIDNTADATALEAIERANGFVE